MSRDERSKIILAVSLAASLVLLGAAAFLLTRETPEDLCVLGRGAELENRIEDALDYYTRAAVKIRDRDGADSPAYAEVILMQGKIYYVLTRYREAADFGEKAAKIFSRHNLPAGIITAEINTANALSAGGDYSRAAQHFYNALKLNEKSHRLSPEDLLSARLGLGINQMNSGKFTEARAIFLECLPEVINICGKQSARTATLYYYLGNTCLALQQLDQAAVCFDKTLQLQQEAPVRSDYGIALSNWGSAKVLFALKKYRPARERAETALRLLQSNTIETELIKKTMERWPKEK